MQNSVAAKTHPCFKPFFILELTEVVPSKLTVFYISSWKDSTRLSRRGGQPIFSRILKRPYLLTVSNAFVRSRKAMYMGFGVLGTSPAVAAMRISYRSLISPIKNRTGLRGIFCQQASGVSRVLLLRRVCLLCKAERCPCSCCSRLFHLCSCTACVCSRGACLAALNFPSSTWLVNRGE